MSKWKNALLNAEKGLARSVLKWKLQKEGKPMPSEEQLDLASARTVEEANRIFKERGKNILDEAKRAAQEFKNGSKREEKRPPSERDG